jgi:hypothetical protein
LGGSDIQYARNKTELQPVRSQVNWAQESKQEQMHESFLAWYYILAPSVPSLPAKDWQFSQGIPPFGPFQSWIQNVVCDWSHWTWNEGCIIWKSWVCVLNLLESLHPQQDGSEIVLNHIPV